MPVSQTTHALTITRVFDAPPERVWKAWTDPAALKVFHAPAPGFSVPSVDVDVRPGGRFRIEMKTPEGVTHVAIGVYREVTPPTKLVYTWGREAGSAACDGNELLGETVVTLTFKKKGKGTELTLTHELFPDEVAREKHHHGWSGILEQLQTFLR